MVAIQQLRLVVLTVSTAVWEILATLLITFLSLFGFAVMFFVRYGSRFSRFGTIPLAFAELFIFACRTFETKELFHSNPVFFIVFFPIVQLIFVFVLANMFLAVIVYKWREVRRSAQEDVVSTLKSCWKSLACIRRVSEKESEAGTDQVGLDRLYWQGCAILNYLSLFDDAGMIRGLDKKAPAANKDGGTGDGVATGE